MNKNEALPPKVKTEIISGKTVTIYFPEGYSRDSTYPTIYFHDGQWLFRPDWRMDDILDVMIWNKQIEPVLLVGIHSSESRNSELLPFLDDWIIQNYGFYTPNAVRTSDLVHHAIIPHLEENYGASSSPEDRALFGVSFAGLHTMWDATQHEESWGMIASISPSFWVNNYQIFTAIGNSEIQPATKIWFDIGTAEWEYYVPIVQNLVDKGYAYGVDAFYYEIPDADHSVASWVSRIHMPILIFAGIEESQISSWQLVVEFIPSQQTNAVFKRINPIITMSNGVKYSACSQAQYKLLNPEAGEVTSDGRFEFSGTAPLNVEVTYKDFKEIVQILPQ